jgi:hypothetical protein
VKKLKQDLSNTNNLAARKIEILGSLVTVTFFCHMEAAFNSLQRGIDCRSNAATRSKVLLLPNLCFQLQPLYLSR